MTRKISVSWFKQRSGWYALKGISILEDNHAYDSGSTFREEDAKWVTEVLGAQADIEMANNRMGDHIAANYPEWAQDTRPNANGDGITPLDCERAGAALLRHYLSRIVAECGTGDYSLDFRKLAQEADAALSATSSGMHFTPEQARAIVNRRAQTLAKTKSRR
jgi:hypothetical protein